MRPEFEQEIKDAIEQASYCPAFDDALSELKKADQCVNILWHEILDSYTEWNPELDALQKDIESRYRRADNNLFNILKKMLKMNDVDTNFILEGIKHELFRP